MAEKLCYKYIKRGITVMTKIKIPFTKEQKEALISNPFTLSVNDYQVRFTVEFKKFLLAEREKNKTPWKEIFRKAGYDTDIISKNRMDGIIKNVKCQAASPKGLRETASKKSLEKGNEKKQTAKAIQELQDEVIHLKQQIEFLKKIQMLKTLEENEE